MPEKNNLLIPVRMVNEYVYCPRLAYMMWVQGEFAHSADTVEGAIRHKRVDKPGGKQPEKAEEGTEEIHARSVALSSEILGITAKIDLVEGTGIEVQPVDYKKGKRPHVAAGAYAPERVQVCAQGLLLREHGFRSDCGILYFAGSRERVKVQFDEDLIAETTRAIEGLRADSGKDKPPPVLVDSPKCARCSLLGICLPDEIGFLTSRREDIRPIYARSEHAFPLYVQSAASYVRKDGGSLVIEEKREKMAEVRLKDTSQVVLFGHCGMSTPALHECFRRQLPVTFMSYGGWFIGHGTGTGHHNVETRTAQYRASFDEQRCLGLAGSLVQAKIQNCRTLLRRNWKSSEDGDDKAPQPLLGALKSDMQQALKADSLQTLLGVEGTAARRYFEHLVFMFSPLKQAERDSFNFSGRNRRPPKDPVNALLSFAYAMLVREWTVVLSAVGLDPYRGFYHQMRFARPALALDMMEPFRPLVADSTVITVINNGEVKMQDFITTAFGCNLTPRGRKAFITAFERRLAQEVTHPVFGYRLSYRRLFEVQARLLIRYLTGEILEYPTFVTR
ncbi:CRISPR-associated endonuclease Cas1 [uncultured Desulfobacter sp.]|uniref:CRISPR-associated endonuclease Cas4g/Cas1g n=1 Tax=uncultured Desulfobacter sp. TaxID=240139 RepID=UPI002AAB0D12|nr:CRISPR-associated endonuclease Cas1 [uncultured Desulfobacter sp.]